MLTLCIAALRAGCVVSSPCPRRNRAGCSYDLAAGI